MYYHCFIISAITYTYNKAKDRAVDKAINDNIQDGFVCLGDVYINKYSIESIYLDDNGHLVDIKTDYNQYSYRFTSEVHIINILIILKILVKLIQ